MSFAPAIPLAGYAPQPSDATWLATLPPLDQALTQLNLGTLLGSVRYTTLGQDDSGYFTDPKVEAGLAKFQGGARRDRDKHKRQRSCADLSLSVAEPDPAKHQHLSRRTFTTWQGAPLSGAFRVAVPAGPAASA